MNRALFRDEASLALRSKLSTSLEHPGLGRPSGLLALLSIITLATAALGFVPVSLGVTAPGVVRLAQGSLPVLAERSGVLTYVVSERQQIHVEAGQTLARIRNLDLSVSRNSPNSAFSLEELDERRDRVEARLEALQTSHELQLQGVEAMERSLQSLLARIADLVPLYEADIARLTEDLATKELALERGNILGPDVERVRSLLNDRQIQLREAGIRLAETEGEIASLKLERDQLDDAFDREVLELTETLSQIEMSVQTESEIAPLDVTMPSTGMLVPRGFEVGQTVSAGDILFDTVDDDDTFLLEVDVDAAQVGELREGLPVKIALAAYPYFEYGFIDGRVSQFTRAPNEPINFSANLPEDSRFRVVIEPADTSFEAFRQGKTIIPGMSATVHIRKERVALWRLVMAPLIGFQARL